MGVGDGRVPVSVPVEVRESWSLRLRLTLTDGDADAEAGDGLLLRLLMDWVVEAHPEAVGVVVALHETEAGEADRDVDGEEDGDAVPDRDRDPRVKLLQLPVALGEQLWMLMDMDLVRLAGLCECEGLGDHEPPDGETETVLLPELLGQKGRAGTAKARRRGSPSCLRSPLLRNASHGSPIPPLPPITRIDSRTDN